MSDNRNDIVIPVGELCQVQIGVIKYRSVFRGVCAPKYVLLDIPIVKGKYEVIPAGSIFIVRFLDEGMVHGFETTLVKSYTKPFNLWVADYPYKFKTINMRQSRRISTLLPTRLETKASTFFDGAIIDISEKGGLFSTIDADESNFSKGATCHVSVSFPSSGEVENIKCKVCSVQTIQNHVQVGLCFLEDKGKPYLRFKSFYDSCRVMWV